MRLPLNQTFTYRIDDEQKSRLLPGMRIVVPFHGKNEEAIALTLHNQPVDYETYAVQEIIDDEPVLNSTQLELGIWISEYYMAGTGETLFKMFPVGKRKPARRNRNPADISETKKQLTHTLNEEQQQIYDLIIKDMNFGNGERGEVTPVHLVEGVTGSGKTELYIRLLLSALEQNKEAILLVPEISLTIQLVERLRAIFGEELALLHSGMKNSERFASYMSLIRKEKRIAVGTRSAIFAPLENIGLIIIDEEHDSSYKEHSSPRYDARQAALKRAGNSAGVLVLGSATPRVESRYLAVNHMKTGEFQFHAHRLKKRATGASLPHVRIIQAPPDDIPFSGSMAREIELNLKNGEQTILLMNRRGYAPFLYCEKCKKAVSCPRCSVTLTYHMDGRAVCHYCGFTEHNSDRCGVCGGPLKKRGTGTQKLEDYLLNLFPRARIERLDTDAARDGAILQEVITRLIDGELDILVGTQMIAKGIDAPNVTLVGVLQADSRIALPDFRAYERTFSLLTQVAGRAGRAEKPGRVLMEALNPEGELLQLASRQDYDTFYNEEIVTRREMQYPPFLRLIRLLYRSEERNVAEQHMMELAGALQKVLEKKGSVDSHTILGPVPAPIERMNEKFRFHIIIKTKRMKELRNILAELLPRFRGKNDSYLEIDFDPVDLL